MSTELATKQQKANEAYQIALNPKNTDKQRARGIRDMIVLQADDMRQAMGETLTPERMAEVASMSILKTPKLLECNIPSLFAAIKQAGTYGLVVDGTLGDAYLVPYGKTATLIIGYRGMRKMVDRSGKCQHVLGYVREGDEWEYRGSFERPIHVESEDQDRDEKPLLWAYVLAKFTDGTYKCFAWSKAKCIRHRDRYSKGWSRMPADQRHWDEKHPSFPTMCMKSVLRYVCARGELPMSVDENRLVQQSMAYESSGGTTIEIAGLDVLAPPEDDEDTVEGTATPSADPDPLATDDEAAEAPSEKTILDGIEEQYRDCRTRNAVDRLHTKIADDPTLSDEIKAASLQLRDEYREKVKTPKQKELGT